MPHLREREPMTGAAIRPSKATAVRYARERPGQLVHVDVKKLGRIPQRKRLARPRGREEFRGGSIGYD